VRHNPYDSWLVTVIQSLRGDMKGAMRDVVVIAVVVVAVLASGRELTRILRRIYIVFTQRSAILNVFVMLCLWYMWLRQFVIVIHSKM